MKIALVTTTINVPRVLQLYRRLGPDVRFFVAFDENTPEEAVNFCVYDLPNTQCLYIQDQQKWKCSELLGFSNDSRRNIALLEAIRWGAEIIVSCDDDMLGRGFDFFQIVETVLTQKFSGLQLGLDGFWADVGRFTVPPVPQRGLPLNASQCNGISFVVDAQVGVMQGIILGVPDTDASSMASGKNFVHSTTDILRNGLVVHPGANAVFNSQFTAFRRELAPCFAQFYKWQGRNTDIFASLIMRRVMRERNLYTYFGPPFGFHARTPRDPLKDLKAEMWGLEHVAEFAQWLDSYIYMSDDKTAAQACRRIYEGMSEHILPRANIECALAFLDDTESVL